MPFSASRIDSSSSTIATNLVLVSVAMRGGYGVAKSSAIIRWYDGLLLNRLTKRLQSIGGVTSNNTSQDCGLLDCRLGLFIGRLYPFLFGGSSSFAAILTSSANDSAFILRITCPR